MSSIRGAPLEAELAIERMQDEHVSMGARWRAWTAVARPAKAVGALGWCIGRGRDPDGKTARRRARQVVGDPVDEFASVGVRDDQGEGLRAFRRVGPAQVRRYIFAVAAEPSRNGSAVRKCRARQGEGPYLHLATSIWCATSIDQLGPGASRRVSSTNDAADRADRDRPSGPVRNTTLRTLRSTAGVETAIETAVSPVRSRARMATPISAPPSSRARRANRRRSSARPP